MDLLDLFPSEKTAAVEEAKQKAKAGPLEPDLGSDDKGERAIAAMAVTGSTAALLGPAIATVGLLRAMGPDYDRWYGGGISKAKSVNEVLTADFVDRPKAKMLGTIPLTARERPFSAAESNKINMRLKEMRPIVDSFIDKHKLTEKGVRLDFRTGPMTIGPAYDVLRKRVNLPMINRSYALHELGHAQDYATKHGKKRFAAEIVAKTGVAAALPIALVAGDRIKEMIPGSIDDKAINFLQQNAPEIMGATYTATTLVPEAKASIAAIKHVAQQEGTEAAIRVAKELTPGYASYVLAAIPALVGLSLARKYMNENPDEDEGTEKRERLLKELSKSAGVASKASDVIGGVARRVSREVDDFFDESARAAKDIGRAVKEYTLDTVHVGKQIGKGATELIMEPGTTKKILAGAKEVGTSPQFALGALASALPVTMGALYMYGTEGGRLIKERLPEKRQAVGFARETEYENRLTAKASEEWRRRNPLRYAGLVGLGAALSGGIATKLVSDLQRVL